jgi:hypothetical protein
MNGYIVSNVTGDDGTVRDPNRYLQIMMLEKRVLDISNPD